MRVERRVKRSYNVHEALELQLAASLERANFTSVILAEDQGFAVAGAGQVLEDEEIAALAPSLAPGQHIWQGKIAIDNGPEKMVTILPVATDVGNLYLCGVGGECAKIHRELAAGIQGVNRILA